MKKIPILLICFVLLNPAKSYSAINPKDQAKVIFYTGLYGAVLGLSTLSFYDKPGNHTRNIAMGAALGLLTSVVVSTIVATKKDKERIRTELLQKGEESLKKEEKDDGKNDKNNKDKINDKVNNKDLEKAGDDFFDDEDLFMDEDEDIDDFGEDFMYYQNNNNVKIFFASFTNDKVSFNPDFLYLSNNFKNNGYNLYGKVLSFRF